MLFLVPVQQKIMKLRVESKFRHPKTNRLRRITFKLHTEMEIKFVDFKFNKLKGKKRQQLEKQNFLFLLDFDVLI